MSAVRRIRVIPSAGAEASNDFDRVSNPALLARSIFNFESEERSRPYTASIRMSSLADVCIRERYLGVMAGEFFQQKVWTGLQFTFDLGHAIHDFLQNHPNYFGDRRLGWWRCLNCNYEYFGGRPQTKCVCCSAGRQCIRYREHAIDQTDPYFVTGHIDSFISVVPGLVRVADFKTIGSREFKTLKAPKGEHKIQVGGYMLTCQYDTSLPVKVDAKRGLILYVCKEAVVGELPIKVFHVDLDHMTEKYIRDTLGGFTDAIKTNTCPEAKAECLASKFQGTRAKACPMREVCANS